MTIKAKDKIKTLARKKAKFGFKDLHVVDYLNDYDPLLNQQAVKRHRGIKNEEVSPLNEQAIALIEDYLDEARVLTVVQRKKRGLQARKNKRKLQLGAKRARNRIATKKVLDKRNRRTSRLILARKLTKGKEKRDLPVGRKQEIEKRLSINNPRIKRIQTFNRIATIKRDRGKL